MNGLSPAPRYPRSNPSFACPCLLPTEASITQRFPRQQEQFRTLWSLPACCRVAAGGCHPSSPHCRAGVCSCPGPGQSHSIGCRGLWELEWTVAMAPPHLWGNSFWTKGGKWRATNKACQSAPLRAVPHCTLCLLLVLRIRKTSTRFLQLLPYWNCRRHGASPALTALVYNEGLN